MTINVIFAGTLVGDFKQVGPLEAIQPKYGANGMHIIQASNPANSLTDKITKEVPVNFEKYSMKELTDYSGKYIPLTLYLTSGDINSPVSEMI